MQRDHVLSAVAAWSSHLMAIEVAAVDLTTLLQVLEAEISCRRQRQCARNCNLDGGKMMINVNDGRVRPRICTYVTRTFNT